MYAGSNGSVRMRSGSGTSRTTTTSDSDFSDNYSTPQQSRTHHPTFASSLSPSRHPQALPSAYSPGQPSAGSSSSTSRFTVPSPSPVPVQSYSAVPPPMTAQLNAAAASALSPIANRMRERDADAMEKYKLRQRSGSAATTSTDAQSANGTTAPTTTSNSSRDEDANSMHNMVTIGSVAPRRLLRPSASAAQLRSVPSPISPQNPHPSQQDPRLRSGTNPSVLNQSPSLTSSPPDSVLLSTPTQSSARPQLLRNGGAAKLMGPGTDTAQFPPPVPLPREPPEKSATSGSGTFSSIPMLQAALPTRRLPFNLLSSHHRHAGDQAHKRNASVNSLGAKVS